MPDVVNEKFDSQTGDESLIESKQNIFVAAKLVLTKACASEHPLWNQT